ncbi:hypothetical protein [Acidiphilium cryptum]|nr:hypothetical protein [Acidiphilium cryptum]
MNRNEKIDPFTLIAIPPEGELLAGFVERYARATCERILPSLALTVEERQELIRQDLELHEQMRQDSRRYEIGAAENWQYANPEGSFDMGLNSTSYAEMEAHALQIHILGLAFAGLFHIFERQLVMILHRLDYRRQGGVMKLIPAKDRHKFVGYKLALDIGGYPISGDTETFVERLRLIANIMKHGTAGSILSLHSKFPEMFWLGSTKLDIETIQLTPGLLLETAAALARYWREFPHA